MQPNIIFICADQMAAASVGCYGSKINSTPTLDMLAREGVRFDRCYTTSPLCSPNRAAMLTGRSPVVCGVTTNNMLLNTDTPTYAHVLKHYGYRTGGFGKFHQTPMMIPLPADLNYLGFDESIPTEDPKWGPWIEWISKEHPEHLDVALAHAWQWPDRPKPMLSHRAEEARQQYLAPAIGQSGWGNMYHSPLPKEVHDSTFITNRSIDFIDRHLSEYRDKPFFCYVSYVDPHDPYNPPAPYDTMFSPEDMEDPVGKEWDDGKFPVLERYSRVHGYNEFRKDPDRVRKMKALYHGSVRFVDDEVGRIVNFVKQKGMIENTVILFTTDHGDMIGDHGLITKMAMHYDKSVRCPLIVYGRNVAKGKNCHGLTCALDFFPTFCDWAGIDEELRPPLEGKSFAGACQPKEETKRWNEISVSFGGVTSVVTDDGWRLSCYLTPGNMKKATYTNQMFNLVDDPDEQTNLYYDINYTDKKIELLERMVKVLELPRNLRQYRNMIIENKKRVWFYPAREVPLYGMDPNPFLQLQE